MSDTTAMPPVPARQGSLNAVLAAFTAGARTVDDLARATGVDRDLVRLALDQLTSLGLVTVSSMSLGCPEDGCSGCAAPTGNSCAAPGPEQRGRLLSFTPSRRTSS